MYTVPAFGRMGLDPLHNPCEAAPVTGYDEQVYMGGHDTEIGKPKAELFSGVFQDKQHGFFAHITFKDPFFVISP
jgi:hypothetical protein